MRKTISIFLASLVLISNIGITYATHYCAGFAVESQLMLGHDKLSCGMPDMDRDCENLPPDKEILTSKSCCDNQYQTLDTDDEFSGSEVQPIPSPEFVIAFVHAFLTEFSFLNNRNTQLAQYSPPLLEYNLPVLNQVFLL